MIYTYDSATCFNLKKLHQEVEDSAMADKSLEKCKWKEPSEELKMEFTNTLSGGDKTILDGIVAAHSANYPFATNLSRSIAYMKFGFNGKASVGRWLQVHYNVPSKNVPIISAVTGNLCALAINAEKNTTGVVTLYINGQSVETIALSGTDSNYKDQLDAVISAGDKISAKVTSGEFKKPILGVYIRGRRI